MKTKTIIIISVVIAVLAIAYFVFLKGKTTTAANGSAQSLGMTKTGKPYTEADVTKEMNVIKGDSNWYGIIKANAARDSEAVEVTLRKNAIYMIEQYH